MCFPNFLEKRGESVGSSLEARLVDDADFLKTTMGSGRGSIGLRHTWRRQRERSRLSSRSTGPDGEGVVVRKREMRDQ